MVSQAVVFLLSGYDNLATTLSFCCYHLAQNPDLQDQAREEVMLLQDLHGGEITYEAIQEAKFLDACIAGQLQKL